MLKATARARFCSRTGDFSCGQTGAQISCVPADLRGRGINNHSPKFVQLPCWVAMMMRGASADTGVVPTIGRGNLQAGG
jgi:hypothetical protein